MLNTKNSQDPKELYKPVIVPYVPPEKLVTARMFRHAFSCANLAKEQGIKIKQISEQDPGLTIWGIISTLLQSNSNDNSFDLDIETPVVHVSPLIRTWMTAILLFGPQLKENPKLTLMVSPFISEQSELYAKPFAKDNTRNTFKVQIDRINLFFYVLKRIQKLITPPPPNDVFRFDLFSKLNELFTKEIEIIDDSTPGSKPVTINLNDISDIGIDNFNSKPKEIAYKPINIGISSNVWFGMGKGENLYVIEQIDKVIKQFISSETEDNSDNKSIETDETFDTDKSNETVESDSEYTPLLEPLKFEDPTKINGGFFKSNIYDSYNIKSFFSWFYKNSKPEGYFKERIGKKIYIVSHSGVLKDISKEINPAINIKENIIPKNIQHPSFNNGEMEYSKKLKDENTWSLQFNVNLNNNNIILDKRSLQIYRGMPKPSSISTQTGKCEPACVFGYRTTYKGTQERMNDCNGIVNPGKEKPARLSLRRRFRQFFGKDTQYKKQTPSNGGKNKTRRHKKNKTQKRQGKK